MEWLDRNWSKLKKNLQYKNNIDFYYIHTVSSRMNVLNLVRILNSVRKQSKMVECVLSQKVCAWGFEQYLITQKTLSVSKTSKTVIYLMSGL